MLYNVLQYPKLKRNAQLLKKYGIKKFYFDSIQSKDFAQIDMSELDRAADGTMDHSNNSIYLNSEKETQKSIDEFAKMGYAVLPGYLDERTVDEINAAVDTCLNEGKIKFSKKGNKNKLLNLWQQIPAVNKIANNPVLLDLLKRLQGGNPALFQSINFLTGSQQQTHSDSIHMSTFPEGGLWGLWIALEDIEADAGPLHYYPKSHLLPYISNEAVGLKPNRFWIAEDAYKKYEAHINKVIQQADFKKEIFLPKKGDLLIWHANLLHGGEPQINPEATRKSMVLHYMNTEAICYHEITQRPALI